MYLYGAHSGFKPESPIDFRARTLNSCNKALEIVTTILDDFTKLRSASIYCVMSVFPIATTRIPLGGLS